MGLFIGAYQNLIVVFSYGILLAMLIVLSSIKLNHIKSVFGKISGKAWMLLGLIFLAGLIIRLFVFPHYHRVYLDEQLYLEYAKNIHSEFRPQVCNYIDFDESRCTFRPQTAVGWPVLLSLAFRIFGPSPEVAFYLSSMMGSLSVILIFFLVYLVFKSQPIALWSSVFMAFTPLYVIWSNTAGNNMPSMFFLLLTLVFFFSYVKTKERKILALFAMSLVFSVIVRFENAIVVLPLLLILIRNKSLGKNRLFESLRLLYPTLLIAFLVLVMISVMVAGRYFEVLTGNLLDLYLLKFFPLLGAASFGYFFLLLAPIALIFPKKVPREGVISLFTFFIFFFALYLPLFFEERMALVPGVFLIMLSACSIEAIAAFLKEYMRNAAIFVAVSLMVIFGMSLAIAHEKALSGDHAKILETNGAHEIKGIIPDGCYLVSEWPMVLGPAPHIRGIYTHILLRNAHEADRILNAGGCIYYFQDAYCADDSPSPSLGSRERCSLVREKFNLAVVEKFRRGESEYILFKIVGIT